MLSQLWARVCGTKIPQSVFSHACSVISNSCVMPWTVAHKVPLFTRFSRQEYCSGLPFPSRIADFFLTYLLRASLVAQTVKRLSAIQETRVWSLGWEDVLEKEMAAHSSILAWKIPWMAEPGKLLSTGSQRLKHNWATSVHFTSLRLVVAGA